MTQCSLNVCSLISTDPCSDFQWEQRRPVEKQLKRLPAATTATCSRRHQSGTNGAVPVFGEWLYGPGES